MNIQFMTAEKNGIETGGTDWSGEKEYRYIPDFDELIANASCDEEIKAIKEVQKYIEDGLFDGFVFEVVFMAYDRYHDFTTGESGMKWQMYQNPWYRDGYGVRVSKERVIVDIACMMDEMSELWGASI